MAKDGCYNCSKRQVGCHSVCETYKAYRLQKDIEMAQRYERNEGRQVFTERRKIKNESFRKHFK